MKEKLTKEQKLIEKEKNNEKTRIHKALVAMEEENLKKDKIAPEGPFISLQHINKIYDNHFQAVYDFNLDIYKNEFIVFVGPSGCGKSTTLRMIAGLEQITAGDFYLDGVYTNAIPAKDRNIAMVFQSYALYPHLTVYDNLAFSLKIIHMDKEEIRERVKKTAEILQITEILNRKPSQLSGGQCQRVALGRAIIRDSKLFLMDEPLSNLDAKLRVSMRSEIISLHNKLNATTIYVTHDQTEAMTMASRIVVMKDGYIQQVGTPAEIYSKPINTFVASFIGSPAMNLIDFNLKEDGLYLGEEKMNFIDLNFKKIKSFYVKELKTYKEQFVQNDLQNETRQNLLKHIEELENSHAEGKEEAKRIKALSQAQYSLEILNKADKTRNHLLEVIASYEKMVEENNFQIILGLRPDDFAVKGHEGSKFKPSKPFSLEVDIPELLGHTYYLHCHHNDVQVTLNIDADAIYAKGDKIKVTLNTDKLHIFDKITTKRVG